MTLGSLFDGSGGFPLAGVLNGITPVWASEIEPYPLRVTALRFPEMKQLGDIRGINGAEIEPVDIITFGSPCQDLSVAGKQKGLVNGARSNLFFEAIRIIKEMRNATHDKYPRFAVWENVPGAFSSNKGWDFHEVLRQLLSISSNSVSLPFPDRGGWTKAGCIVGEGHSLAWRTYDAQYWGVPQRRKRIYLVADFGSERAGEILFESEGRAWDFETGGEARQTASAGSPGSAGGSDRVWCLKGNFIDRNTRQNGTGWRPSPMYTLDSTDRHAVCVPVASFMANPGASAGSIAYNEDGVSPTLRTSPPPAYCYDARGNGCGMITPTIVGDHQNRITDYTTIVVKEVLRA